MTWLPTVDELKRTNKIIDKDFKCLPRRTERKNDWEPRFQ